MKITFVEDLRDHMPGVLLGCQLLKVPIDKLDRAKLTRVLKSAMAHDDIIVNCDKERFGRMTMETATKTWVEVGLFPCWFLHTLWVCNAWMLWLHTVCMAYIIHPSGAPHAPCVSAV